ncbi:MAG TPA: PEPxxWA-CTERM sorting domain-containing protein, partial [Caulobacteraceae bacterium]
AYNAYGNPASFSGAGFELVSGDFTAAWNDGLSILVQGYNGASLIDTTTFVVNTSGPTLETFDWTGLTSVTFTSSGGTHNPNLDGNGEHFALDNLSVAVPEPATWALLLVGFAGLGAVARRRRAFA